MAESETEEFVGSVVVVVAVEESADPQTPTPW